MKEQAWSCQDVEREVFVLLRGGLPVVSETRARAHIESCGKCAATVQQWQTWQQPLEQAVAAPLSQDHAASLVASIMTEEEGSGRGELPPGRQDARRNWGWGIIAVAASVALAIWMRPQPEPTPVPVEVAQVLGTASEGAELIGDVRMGKASMKLSAHARVRVEQTASLSPVLRLERGTIDVDVQPLAPGEELRACTQLTCVRVIGTHFSMQRSRSDVIKVEHGVVAISHAALPDAEIVLHSGEEFITPWQHAVSTAEEAPKPEPTPSADNTRPEDLMRQAESALQKNNPAAARHAFDELTRRFPSHPLAAEAAYAAATTALDQGLLREGYTRLSTYVRHYPNGAFVADALWRMGTLSLEDKRMDAAARALEQLLATAPSFSRRAEATFLLAGLREATDPALAARLYTQVLSEHPSTDLAQKARAKLSDL